MRIRQITGVILVFASACAFANLAGDIFHKDGLTIWSGAVAASLMIISIEIAFSIYRDRIAK